MKTTAAILDSEDKKFMETMLQALHTRYRLLWQLGIFTGLRISDLLRIRVADIQEHLTLREQKTGKIREIALSAVILADFMRFIRVQGLKPNEYVFFSSCSNRRKPISRQWANTIIARTSRLRGLSDVGSHSMRKTFACEIFQKTGSIYAVQQALNHSKVGTTEAYLKDIKVKTQA